MRDPQWSDEGVGSHQRSMKRAVALAALMLAVSPLTTALPAEASRRVVDVTDAETKAFCEANPGECKTSIRWDITIGWLLVLLLGPFAWKYLNQGLLAGVHRSYDEATAVKPHERP